MNEKEKTDIVSFFRSLETDVDEACSGLFLQLHLAYPKSDTKFTGMPEGCENIRSVTIDKFMETVEKLTETDLDRAAHLYMFWTLKIVCYRKLIEKEKNLTYPQAIEIFKALLKDMSPLLLNIGRFDQMAYHKDQVVNKAGRTKHQGKENRILIVRSKAEQYWTETGAGFEIPFDRWAEIIEEALDQKGLRVSDKTLTNYRSDVEELLKKEGSKTPKIILKRKSLR